MHCDDHGVIIVAVVRVDTPSFLRRFILLSFIIYTLRRRQNDSHVGRTSDKHAGNNNKVADLQVDAQLAQLRHGTGP